jgi:outer membrane protein TolC
MKHSFKLKSLMCYNDLQFKKQRIRLLVICILVSFCYNSNAQLQPAAVIADSTINGVDTSGLTIEEKLVALALNGPLLKASDNQNKINEYQLKAAKNTWVNLLTLSANFNDQNVFTQSNQPANVVFPRYFFGLNIPLGTLLSRTTVKSAREQVEISKNNQTQLQRNTKADILSKYRQYKNLEDLIKIQIQTLDDEETAYVQAQEKFRNGLIPIELYNAAQKNYNNELAKKINLQMDQDLLKIEIERIIGATLENVINKK